jgi:hypothetical protein
VRPETIVRRQEKRASKLYEAMHGFIRRNGLHNVLWALSAVVADEEEDPRPDFGVPPGAGDELALLAERAEQVDPVPLRAK